MKFVLPRVVRGNRGDIASRWGVLCGLNRIGQQEVVVFRGFEDEIPPFMVDQLPYGPLRNLLPNPVGWRALRSAEVVLWTAGLDLQDDSSLAKLCYLWLAFQLYRRLGLRVWCLFQGAGPLETSLGRGLARQALKQVELFVARDPGSYRLVEQICPECRRRLGYDGIFLPGIEQEVISPRIGSRSGRENSSNHGGRPMIGFNVRQWFHLRSSLLPYEFAQEKYLQRSANKMKELLHAACRTVDLLRGEIGAQVLLISAYRPGVAPWEDDLPWLEQVKAKFADDPQVGLIRQPMTTQGYFRLISGLDLMIGMRLHSSLTAIRLGVPSINMSYTLKGGDVMRYLNLPENVFNLEQWIRTPQIVAGRASSILQHYRSEKDRAGEATERAISFNLALLREILNR